MPKEVDILFRVLEIRQENGMDFPNDLNHLKITIRKSALFHRMMEGKEPLPEPPPRAFSYPWYEIIEDGYGYPHEVWEATEKAFVDFPAIGIDQSIWKLIEKLGDNDYIVSYLYGKDQKVSESKWHVYPIASRVPQNPKYPSSNYLWKIEKVE
jgi:hypothetical protein